MCIELYLCNLSYYPPLVRTQQFYNSSYQGQDLTTDTDTVLCIQTSPGIGWELWGADGKKQGIPGK